jgi:hypothetical protein
MDWRTEILKEKEEREKKWKDMVTFLRELINREDYRSRTSRIESVLRKFKGRLNSEEVLWLENELQEQKNRNIEEEIAARK